MKKQSKSVTIRDVLYKCEHCGKIFTDSKTVLCGYEDNPKDEMHEMKRLLAYRPITLHTCDPTAFSDTQRGIRGLAKVVGFTGPTS
jgi:hypothetical protein